VTAAFFDLPSHVIFMYGINIDKMFLTFSKKYALTEISSGKGVVSVVN